MRLFGLEIKRATLNTVADNRGGWWPWVREPYAGAWQRNDEWTVDTVAAHSAVYACTTLIANDIGKLRPKLVAQADNGIWEETQSAAFSPVLRRPNRFQNHIQFKQWWITCKLMRGNAYHLLERDARGVVVGMYPLDPDRVQVLVAPDGSVFYKLGADNLSGLDDDSLTVPASEIIHDRMNCLFHPLVGVSPLFAAGAPANIGLKIQGNSTTFFGNRSAPGGILTAPGAISDETAARLSAYWQANFTGTNAGKVAVVGDGLKFEPMTVSAVDSQLIEQLRWSGEMICSVFHVPSYMVGIGPAPSYNNVEALWQQYYAQCLQILIEEMEACLDQALGIAETETGGRVLGVELDLDGLLRMDTSTLIGTLEKAVGAGIMAPDEARRRIDLSPVAGGNSPYLQQQNYSLAALAKRDAQADPFATATPEPTPAVEEPPAQEEEEDGEDIVRGILEAIEKGLTADA